MEFGRYPIQMHVVYIHEKILLNFLSDMVIIRIRVRASTPTERGSIDQFRSTALAEYSCK